MATSSPSLLSLFGTNPVAPNAPTPAAFSQTPGLPGTNPPFQAALLLAQLPQNAALNLPNAAPGTPSLPLPQQIGTLSPAPLLNVAPTPIPTANVATEIPVADTTVSSDAERTDPLVWEIAAQMMGAFVTPMGVPQLPAPTPEATPAQTATSSASLPLTPTVPLALEPNASFVPVAPAAALPMTALPETPMDSREVAPAPSPGVGSFPLLNATPHPTAEPFPLAPDAIRQDVSAQPAATPAPTPALPTPPVAPGQTPQPAPVSNRVVTVETTDATPVEIIAQEAPAPVWTPVAAVEAQVRARVTEPMAPKAETATEASLSLPAIDAPMATTAVAPNGALENVSFASPTPPAPNAATPNQAAKTEATSLQPGDSAPVAPAVPSVAERVSVPGSPETFAEAVVAAPSNQRTEAKPKADAPLQSVLESSEQTGQAVAAVSAKADAETDAHAESESRQEPGSERLALTKPDAAKPTVAEARTSPHPAAVSEATQTARPATAADVRAETPTNAPIDRSQVIAQVSRHLEAMRLTNGQGQLSLQLTPEHLGGLRVTISQQGESVLARIVTETTQAQQAVESGKDQLRVALEQKGLRLSGLEVSVGQGAFSNSGAFYGSPDTPQERGTFRANGRYGGYGSPTESRVAAVTDSPVRAVSATDPRSRLDYHV